MKKWLIGLVLVFGGTAFGVASTLVVQSYLSEPKSIEHPKPQDKKQHSPLHSFFSDDFFSSDPLADMQKMREQMFKGLLDQNSDFFEGFGNSFDNVFNGLGGGGNSVTIQSKEDDKYLIYEIVGDGIDAKSININVSNGMVTVAGKVDQKSTFDKNGSTSSYSISSSFNQSFSVPSYVDPGKVKMDHVDGKILIKFPKYRGTI